MAERPTLDHAQVTKCGNRAAEHGSANCTLRERPSMVLASNIDGPGNGQNSVGEDRARAAPVCASKVWQETLPNAIAAFHVDQGANCCCTPHLDDVRLPIGRTTLVICYNDYAGTPKAMSSMGCGLRALRTSGRSVPTSPLPKAVPPPKVERSSSHDAWTSQGERQNGVLWDTHGPQISLRDKIQRKRPSNAPSRLRHQVTLRNSQDMRKCKNGWSPAARLRQCLQQSIFAQRIQYTPRRLCWNP